MGRGTTRSHHCRDNVIWNGMPYSSLSAAARAMTGTANGPRFFGLREDD